METLTKSDLKLIRESCRQFHSKILKNRKKKLSKLELELVNKDIEEIEDILCILNAEIRRGYNND